MSKNKVELKDLQDLAREFNEIMALSPAIAVDSSQKVLIDEFKAVSVELELADEKRISDKGKLVLKELGISVPWEETVVETAEAVEKGDVSEKEKIVDKAEEVVEMEKDTKEEKKEVKEVSKKGVKKKIKEEVKEEAVHDCEVKKVDKKGVKKIKSKKDKAVKSVDKKVKSKKGKTVKSVDKGEKSRYGHSVGTQDALLDDLFYKGVTKEGAVKELVKKFGITEKAAMDKFRWQLWRLRKKVGVAIKLTDGVYKSSK